jgi:hypothetical protein
MTHKGPSSKACSIKFERLPEINDSLEMLTHKRVVVTNYTACFRVVLVVVELLQRKVGQFSLVLFDVEDV